LSLLNAAFLYISIKVELMKFFISAAILISICFTPSDNLLTYCNARFDFCIKYPKNFKKQPDSENGDGGYFISSDKKAEISAFGMMLIGEDEYDNAKYWFSADTAGLKVSYKFQKPNWFVFSGTDTLGNIFYQKTIKKKVHYMGGDLEYVFLTLRIRYPISQNALYSSYCDTIANSFK